MSSAIITTVTIANYFPLLAALVSSLFRYIIFVVVTDTNSHFRYYRGAVGAMIVYDITSKVAIKLYTT